MKLFSLIQFFLIVLVFNLKAEVSEVEQFIKERPEYKAIPEKEAIEQFDKFYADSAYITKRENLTIKMFSRKGVILGFHININDSAKLGGSDLIDDAIEKAYVNFERYDYSRINPLFKRARSMQGGGGASSANENGYYSITLFNPKKIKTVRDEFLAETTEKLKP